MLAHLAVLLLPAALNAAIAAPGEDHDPPLAERAALEGAAVGSTVASVADGDGGTAIQSGLLPAHRPPPVGTGTAYDEPFRYQVPSAYDPGAPDGHPLVIACHGFGQSPASVHNQSTLDEECEVRGWLYAAPTGLDDELFGSPVAQQHVEAVLLWMVDQFHVDEDRIYMVGFSAGARTAASFAARRRDPDGPMIAALGLVAGAYDLTQAYAGAAPPTQALMQHPLNFGAPPSAAPFAYAQASLLHFDPGSYPPAPGTLVPSLSMATNLGGVPIYTIWDQFDVTTGVAPQAAPFRAFIQSLGGTIDDNVTFVPGGFPANHSWALLDEDELFDFLDGRRVERFPARVEALLDRSTGVSFLDVAQRHAGAFSALEAQADPAAARLVLSGVTNAAAVTADLGEAGLRGAAAAADAARAVLHVDAGPADADGFTLRLRGFAEVPSYLVDAVSGELVPGADVDPLAHALTTTVPGGGALQVDVVAEPWSSLLTTTPRRARVGHRVDLSLATPAGAGARTALLVVGVREELVTIAGGAFTLGTAPEAAALLVPLALDARGAAAFDARVPPDPAFAGTRLVLQAVALGAAGDVVSVSNLWTLYVH